MKITTFIYILKDPITNEVRYVGKSNDPLKRLYKHLCTSSNDDTHRKNWISKLLKDGLKPILEIIDEVPKSEWQLNEKKYINYYTSIGCDLVNWSDGGEGLTYGNQTSFKKNHGAKKIIAIAKDGSIFKEFESSAKAQEYFDRVGCGGVYMVLKKKRRFYMGYNYLFLDEYNSMSDEDFKKHLDWINNYTQTTEWRREQGKKLVLKKVINLGMEQLKI